MDRLFLDANILFSAAYRSESGLRRLWTCKVELVTSRFALDEALRNLSTDRQREDLADLMEPVDMVDHPPMDQISLAVDLPPKDQPILAAALRSDCTHLITGDHQDFGEFFGRTVQGVIILRPATYLHRNSSPEGPE